MEKVRIQTFTGSSCFVEYRGHTHRFTLDPLIHSYLSNNWKIITHFIFVSRGLVFKPQVSF